MDLEDSEKFLLASVESRSHVYFSVAQLCFLLWVLALLTFQYLPVLWEKDQQKPLLL